ncbi:hypothetical protein GXW82_06715 [Streptacidiphilus sp. 4-A2]|nr:hypothetical protein [Streptacidiphilus sp. 4-A2]
MTGDGWPRRHPRRGLGLVGVSYGRAFIDEHVAHAAKEGGLWGVGCVMFTFDQRPGLWSRSSATRPR